MRDYANGGGSTDPGASEERARSERSAKLRSRWSMHDGPRRRSCWAYTISEMRCCRRPCSARGCTAGAGAGAPSESSLSAKLRSRRSRLDIRSWRLLLRKSGMARRQKEQARLTQLEVAPREVRHAQQEYAWSEAQTHVQSPD